MKSLIAACFVFLVFPQIVNADIAKPKQPEKAARYVLHTSLEIVPDATLNDAKLQITESDLKTLRAALDGAAGNTTIAASVAQSPARTIIAGVLMFLSLSIVGVLFARSSFGRAQKAVVAVILVAVMLGAAAIITRGNAPPGFYRWSGLPQALAEGKATAGGLDIEIIPDNARSGANMRLVIPLKKKSRPGEE